MSDDLPALAREIFLREAGAASVRQVAQILAVHRIAIMPLKGVLLQRMVYGENRFRPLSDVDILVLEPRFDEAIAALTRAGFATVRWERGRWQATLRGPASSPLPIDLHRRLSRTARSRLTSAGLFARGSTDLELFGCSLRIPSANDLFAHLLLHATGDWLNFDRLHRPGDFDAVANALALDVERCAGHLAAQGLGAHALVILPRLLEQARSPFLRELYERVQSRADRRDRAAARLVTAACRGTPRRHLGRRLAALTLAPSVGGALAEAVRERLSERAQATDTRSAEAAKAAKAAKADRFPAS